MLSVKCHAGAFFLPAERKRRTRCTKRTSTITNADNFPEQKLSGLKFSLVFVLDLDLSEESPHVLPPFETKDL